MRPVCMAAALALVWRQPPPLLSCWMTAGTKFQCDYPEKEQGGGSGQCVEVRGQAASHAQCFSYCPSCRCPMPQVT